MKNSVWHYKLWKKKLNELPVDADLNAAWSEMQSILDKDLSLGDLPKGGGLATKPLVNKIVSLLGYILPVAAMIVGIVYFAIKQPKREDPRITKQTNKNLLLKVPDTLISKDTLVSDSIIQLKLENSLSTIDSPFIRKNHLTSNPAFIDSIENDPLANSTKEFGKSEDLYSDEAVETSTSTGSDKKAISNGDLVDSEMKNPEKIKANKGKPVKNRKSKHQNEIYTPTYNYGFEAGLNIGSYQNIFLGINAAYAINKRLLINTGLKLNLATPMEGSYRHPNYNLKDSASKENLTILDQRKLTTADITLGLEYKISNRISVKAAPVISLLVINGGTGSTLSSVKNPLDTAFNSKKINAALSNSTINKFNIGFSGGLNIRFKQFNIEAGYRQNFMPYKVSSDMGSYKKTFKTFQIGLGYNFK